MLIEIIIAMILGGITTGVSGWLIIKTQNWHGTWTHDGVDGVQKFHHQPTPRVGGLSIALGSFVATAWLSDGDLENLFTAILCAALVPFFFGLREDVTKRVSVRSRFLATAAGALIAIGLTDIYLTRLDVPGLDGVMTWWPVAVMVTVVAIAGVTNAMNILDGFNGLASGTAVVIFFTLGSMGYYYADADMAGLCAILVSVLLGFMVLNYPFGKIFLGDAGAYFVGFILAWVAVLLPMRHDYLSPWASLLACAYPVVEVLYSMVRRMRSRLSASAPDNLHLHTLIKTRLVRRLFPGAPTWARNALVAPSIWFCSLCLGLAAIHWSQDVVILASIFFGFVWVYHITYRILIRLPEAGGAEQLGESGN